VENEPPASPPAEPPDELETYRRLVELQGQIVDLARRNRESERLCSSLRDRLFRELSRRSNGGPRDMLRRLVGRIRLRRPSRSGKPGNSGRTTPKR